MASGPETSDGSNLKYPSLDVLIDDQVATIKVHNVERSLMSQPPADCHQDIPAALEDLRDNHSVRVIVITGAEDGQFMCALPSEKYSGAHTMKRIAEPYGTYRVMQGVLRCFQMMTEIEKPIIAKVNGDAIGFGQSVMLGCDFIIAREDARISDVHLGMGEVEPSDARGTVGAKFGLVPGDGAGTLIPLFMSPTRAKEYLMLARVHTAAEFADMGIINRAVPATALDATTQEFVHDLLRRSAFALAWTKRVLNRHVATQINLTLDSSLAYEILNFYQIATVGPENDFRALEELEARE